MILMWLNELQVVKPSDANRNNSISQTGDIGKAKRIPKLKRSEVDKLAKEFAQHIPDREFSMAAIQGLLMQYKTRPLAAVREAAEWVEKERKKRSSKEESTRKESDRHTEEPAIKSSEKDETKDQEGHLLSIPNDVIQPKSQCKTTKESPRKKRKGRKK